MEEQFVSRVMRNCAISASLHMRDTLQIRFSIRSNVYISSQLDYKRNKQPTTIWMKLIRSGQFIPTHMVTYDIFFPTVLLVWLQSDDYPCKGSLWLTSLWRELDFLTYDFKRLIEYRVHITWILLWKTNAELSCKKKRKKLNTLYGCITYPFLLKNMPHYGSEMGCKCWFMLSLICIKWFDYILWAQTYFQITLLR